MTVAPIGYSNKDFASLLQSLLDLATQRLPEWTDQSPNDFGVALLELFAAMGDSLFYNMDRIAAESFLATAVERRSVLNHLRLIGYELRPPLAASADLALLFASGATGIVTVPSKAAFKTTAASTGTPINFQYIQPTSIQFDVAALPFAVLDASGKLCVSKPNSAAPAVPAGGTLYRAYQTAPVVQVDMNVANEIVASSDATPGQRYALASAPVIDSTLVVLVDEGAGPVAWSRVDSLLTSAPTDAAYAVSRDEKDTVWIEFGGPPYGRPPTRGLNNITANYSVGGGAKGNVPAMAISKPVTLIANLKLVANLNAAAGGSDAEATADAVRRGPMQFRSGGRAVTAGDYVALALAFGVAKAQAKATNWNRIDLVVAPAGGGYPSETLKQDLATYLDTRRMLGAVVQICDPSYVSVYIDATVTYLPQYSAVVVGQAIRQTVAAYLSFDNLSFGQTLFVSKIYELIQEVEGVAGLNITTFSSGHQYVANQIATNGQLVFGVTNSAELPQWLGFDGVNGNLKLQPGGA